MTDTTTLGRLFIAIAVIASGIQQVATADFVRLVPKLPAWIPWQSFWALMVGILLIAIGVGILASRVARLAAFVLAAMILASFLLLHLPQVATNPGAGFMWTNPCKALALCGGAIILFRTAPEGLGGRFSARVRLLETEMPWGPVLLGGFLLICGIQHFVYADFVAQLVPAWIPARRFWTSFTGMALMAGGVGVVVPRTAPVAATLAGVMIFLWVVLLHIPRALADPNDAGETSAVFEALALSGVAFMVAGTARPSESTRRHGKVGN